MSDLSTKCPVSPAVEALLKQGIPLHKAMSMAEMKDKNTKKKK